MNSVNFCFSQIFSKQTVRSVWHSAVLSAIFWYNIALPNQLNIIYSGLQQVNYNTFVFGREGEKMGMMLRNKSLF